MSVPSHSIICTRKRVVAKDVYEFAFEKPDAYTFKPGQFVLFDVPLVEDPSDIQTRAFSIASAPSESELLFIAKMKEGGRASRWIEALLQEGSRTRIQGPFGNFLLDETTTKEYLFIAGGTGVAPFRSQAIAALERGDSRRMDVIFGVRNEEDLFWKEELESIAKKYENFYVHFALSQPSEDWKGHRGRVQTLAPLIAEQFSQKSVYVCGSPDLTKEVKELALNEWKVEKQDLHVEGYI